MSGAGGALRIRCEEEVLELHRFFVDWLTGRSDPEEEGMARLSDVLGEGFQLIGPDGAMTSRAELLRRLRAGRGSRGADFSIRIESFTYRTGTRRFALVTYEEWQEEGGRARGRVTSAVLREREGTPHGVEWVHVHETWKEESG